MTQSVEVSQKIVRSAADGGSVIRQSETRKTVNGDGKTDVSSRTDEKRLPAGEKPQQVEWDPQF